jgi:plastocyanin
MVAFTSIVVAATAMIGLTSAAPSYAPPTGVIHRIFAGSTTANNGLHFEPENVVAEIGDLIEFHYLPKNHTMTQSSFDKPCEPLAGGIFSGFNFATPVGESKNVFTFTVQNKEPFWYYCSQTAGNHCQMGMSGVINQNFNSPNTLTAYKAKAVGTVTKQPSANPLDFQGGKIVPNKPL